MSYSNKIIKSYKYNRSGRDYKVYKPAGRELKTNIDLMKWLYDNGLNSQEIANLSWRDVRMYQRPEKIVLKRKRDFWFGNKTFELDLVGTPFYKWLRREMPIRGANLFYKELPNHHWVHRGTDKWDGVPFTKEEVGGIVGEPSEDLQKKLKKESRRVLKKNASCATIEISKANLKLNEKDDKGDYFL